MALLPALLTLAGALTRPPPAAPVPEVIPHGGQLAPSPPSAVPPASVTTAAAPGKTVPQASETPAAPATPAKPPSPMAALSGVVTDGVSGKPAADCEVSLPELRLQTRADSAGKWSFPSVPARKKPYEVLVTGAGYKSLTIDVKVPPDQPAVTAPEAKLNPKGW